MVFIINNKDNPERVFFILKFFWHKEHLKYKKYHRPPHLMEKCQLDD